MKNVLSLGSLIVCLLAGSSPIQAQGPPQSAIVTARTALLISGERTLLEAGTRDSRGIARFGERFDWTSNNPSVVSVDATGVATARGLGTAIITAGASGTNVRSSVTIQVVPMRVDILADRYEIFVGDSLQMAPVARDINGGVIPNVGFRWEWTGANGGFTRAATISNTGVLTALGNGLITVKAIVPYANTTSQLPTNFYAYAQVLIKPRQEFRLRRLLANDPITRPLQLRPSYNNAQIASNESGQMAFIADLEGLASTVMRYDNGRLEKLMSAGTPGPAPGTVIKMFNNIAMNNQGDVLVSAQFGYQTGLFLIDKTGVTPVFLQDQNDGGFQRIWGLNITRYSLNDNGDILFRASFNYSGSQGFHTGLFKLTRGVFQTVWVSDDPLPGFPQPYDFSYWGIDRNGIAYFAVTANGGQIAGMYRADGLGTPARVGGTGDRLSTFTITGMTAWTFGMSSDGTLATSIYRSDNKRSPVRYRRGAGPAEFLATTGGGIQDSPLAVNNSGDVIFAGDIGSGWGLHRWSGDKASPLLMSFTSEGTTRIEGATINSYDDAFITSQGTVYGQIKTADNDYLILQTDTRRVLLKAGLSLNVNPNLNFFGFIRGSATGQPHLMTGGQNWSIYESAPQALTPLFVNGDRPEKDTRCCYFNGLSGAIRSPSGDLYFSTGAGVYKLANGKTEKVIGVPFAVSTGSFGTFNVNWVQGGSTAANNNGMLVLAVNADNGRNLLVSISGGKSALLARMGGTDPTPSPSGGFFENTNWNNSFAVDQQGRVMAYFNVRNGPSGLFIYENGAWRSAGTFRDIRFDGLQPDSINSVQAAGPKFIAAFNIPNNGSTIAEYVDGKWNQLMKRGDVMPNGPEINFINGNFAANARGDIACQVYTNGGFSVLMRTADGVNRLVYNVGDVTEAGDIFAGNNVGFELDLRDDRRLYFISTSIYDQQVLYLAEPLF